jgi:cysteine-rich repeat protein
MTRFVLRSSLLLALGLAFCASPARAAVSMGGLMAFSPDDIDATNIPGLLSFSGDDQVATVNLPFTFTVEGVGYTTVAISTNGWMELGGNTAGNSDPTNDCLPTAAHTHPFVAAYWDDMQTAGSSSVQYGVVGSAGNRVFLADFFLDTKTSADDGADDISFQVQLHERSNLVTVRYRSSENLATGQNATIGFQGAGGAAAATVQPLGCNAKILDDNRDDEGWSADVGRAGAVTLAAIMQHSPDDLGAFPTLTGNDNVLAVALPFAVTLDGASYSSLAISTNGWLEFGGNTAANSDPTNDCLPTSAHTNPFLAAYWDDLNPFGTTIRYGSVGTSPNRVYVVDYEVDLTNGSEGSDDLRFQVQIHEMSNLVNVRYWDKQSAATGSGATIGYQGAGGASSDAYPVSCNAAVLDDNDPAREGWSVHPQANGAMSLHAVLAASPDDISGFTALSGNDAIATPTLPFAVNIDGVAYSTVAISTNGWLELGGNTEGTTDPSNDCLPTAAHTNPFLAFYWDSMRTINTAIRYGTVGSSPNRVFVVDVDFENDTADNNDMTMQVQIHERSNTIAVKYIDSQPLANGQTATIGWQSAGGAAATAMPLTCNGKILDDNRPGAGWSVTPLPVCGNGLVESRGNEACDLGGSNGAGTTCCTASCALVGAGTQCRAPGGVCDVAESCTGASPSCPADAKSSAVCRPSGGVCDPTETCDGVSNVCPADAKSVAPCRAAAGVCDVAESCDGVGNACPADAFEPPTTACRPSAGVCDLVDQCPGTGPDCGVDAKSTAVCRPSAGICDVAESCGGVGDGCPADEVAPASTVCRPSGGVCDLTESCDGVAVACPADAKRTAECRAAADVCDVAETCDGAGNDCPADAFAAPTVECRAAAGVCDSAETCTGTGAACPADGFVTAHGLGSCRPSAGPCDVADICPGTGPDCSPDEFAPATTVCRPAVGSCDVDDTCTGTDANCSPDAFVPDGTSCDDLRVCTNADQCVAGTCVGNSDVCGDGVLQPACNEECDDGNQDGNDGCSPICDIEPGLACPTSPLAGCRTPWIPQKSSLQLSNKPLDTKDTLKWKWSKGNRTTFAELGNPTDTTSYQLCVFDQTGLRFEITHPAGGVCGGRPCWKVNGVKGYTYKDKELTPNGGLSLKLKEGVIGKAQIQLQARGSALAMPDLTTLVPPLIVQIQKSGGRCWEAVYSGPAIKQTASQFKDVAD